MTHTTNFIDLDEEYSDIVEARSWLENPEQRLIWAIIERAVRDVLGNQPGDVMSSTEWIWAEDKEKLSEFSFKWCCETLSLDPDQFRNKILRMRKQLNKSELQIAA